MALIRGLSRTSKDGAAIARSLRNPEAFAEVFNRHFVAVYRYLARRAGRDSADDLASQTFTLAFAHRGRYHDELGTARPWLLGIATNLLHAERRAADRRTLTFDRLSAEAVLSSSDPVLVRTSTGSDEDSRLATALSGLAAEQRDALLLHVWGELSYVEVAAALDVPVGTVRSRISRACAALRVELEPLTPVVSSTPASVAGERRNHA